ncbi:MAG: hypothetical protein NT029_00090 [Armatimonadetes bacterium]|nr:hypothetical protein [Armatimonadota bacterium]
MLDDHAGNRLTVLELDGTRVTYTHDAASQLTREQRGGAHPIDDTPREDGFTVGTATLRGMSVLG